MRRELTAVLKGSRTDCVPTQRFWPRPGTSTAANTGREPRGLEIELSSRKVMGHLSKRRSPILCFKGDTKGSLRRRNEDPVLDRSERYRTDPVLSDQKRKISARFAMAVDEQPRFGTLATCLSRARSLVDSCLVSGRSEVVSGACSMRLAASVPA